MSEQPENYVIILGSMKSGTTTLFSMLADHPAIAPAEPKEPGFFAFPEIYEQGFDWYHGLFDFDPNKQVYRLDGSTDYSKAPYVTDVWERMQSRPNARYKLIYIMRHPIKRLQSHARHVQLRKKEIGQHISPRHDHGLDNGVSLAALHMSSYARQLSYYRDAWEQDALYLTTLEELNQDAPKVMAELWDFLDLPAAEEPKAAPKANAADNQTFVSNRWTQLTSNQKLLGAAKAVLPTGLRDKIKAQFVEQREAEGRFEFTAQERQTLEELLEADITALGQTYGVKTRELWGLPAAPGKRV